MKRYLDGYIFKFGDEDICFSDLTELEQDIVLEGRSIEWLKSLCKHLAFVIKNMGDSVEVIVYKKENSGDA